ncbi:MAG: SDR family oxidoreductase [Clostridiales bacterium]|jgi:short-subunit dehydrogenase|nr:SDR family oxidoreductase [Clostridiales bacterium]
MKKTVLITGASGGIGCELAKIFAAEGCDLILTARRADRLDELKASLTERHGISVLTFVQDLSEPDTPDVISRAVTGAGCRVDILVNNAGLGDYGPFAESDLEKQSAVVQVNVAALMRLTRLFLPQMLGRKSGKIINIASIASFMPGPFMSVYYASKAFVLSFSEALARELQGSGVSVTAVCPGPSKTGFAAAAGLNESKIIGAFNSVGADSVARFAYKAAMKNKTVAVHGFLNRLAVFFGVRFLPRRALRFFVAKIQGLRKKSDSN